MNINIYFWLRNDILYAWIIIQFIAASKWEPVLCDGTRFTWERAEKSLNNVTALLMMVRMNSYSKPECSGHKLIRHGMNEEKFLLQQNLITRKKRRRDKALKEISILLSWVGRYDYAIRRQRERTFYFLFLKSSIRIYIFFCFQKNDCR